MDIEFLKSIERKETNFAVRSKAISSINAIAPESVMPQNGIIDAEEYEVPEDVTQDLDGIYDYEDDVTIYDDVQYEPEGQSKSHTSKQTNKPPKTKMTKEERHDESEEKVSVSPIDLGFLPIVVGDEAHVEPEEMTLDTFTSLEQEVLPDGNVEELMTEMEQEAFENYLDELSIPVSDEELAFLPVVVADISSEETIKIEEETKTESQRAAEEEAEKIVAPNAPQNEITLKETTPPDTEEPILDWEFEQNQERASFEDHITDYRELTVNYEEVVIGIDETAGEKVTTEEETEKILDFEIPGDEITVEETSLLDIEGPTWNWVFEQDFHSTSYEEDRTGYTELTVDYEEVAVDVEETTEEEAPLEPMREETPTLQPLEAHSTDLSQRVTAEDDTCITLEIESILNSLPQPKYFDGETIVTMRLLDDIEELGDHREIPLLEELLENAKTEYIRDRIAMLLERFLEELPEKNIEELVSPAIEDLKPFSVFEDLFRTCDIESKLILMDQIVELGDEKEVGFLHSLLEDTEPKIREKAEPILQELEKKLFRESLSFDPSEIFIDEEKGTRKSDWDTALGQLFSIPTKIIESLHG